MKKTFMLLTALFISGILFGQSITVDVKEGCSPVTVHASAVMNNSSVKYYDWYTNSQSTHTFTLKKDTTMIFTKKGYNYVYLCIYDNNLANLGCTSANILVNDYNSIYVSSNKVCPTQPITFSITTNSKSYEADFGDGTKISNTSSIVHSYSNEGVYTLSVKFTGTCGQDTTIQRPITVLNNLPWNSNLKITKGKSISCPNEQISFYISGVYSKTEWTFGDGDNGIGNSTSHIFKNTGKYYVSAKLTNYCGKDTLIKDSVQIKDNLHVTATNSTSIPDNVCPNSSLDFKYNGVRVNSLTWNFGDNDSSQLAYSSHSYTDIRDYPVTLTLRNGCGFDTVFHYTVHIINLPASLSSSPLTAQKACPGDLVSIKNTFKDTCTVDFGDGYFTKDMYSLNHQYHSPGTYPVTITVTNSCGNKASRVDTIHILNNNHAFTSISPYCYPRSAICPGDQVEFSCNYFPSIVWDFGNGEKAYSDYGTTSYSSTGTYHYTLTVKNGCGNDTTLNGNLTVSAGNQASNLYLYAYKPLTCTGSGVQFEASGNSNNIKWYFGDSATSVLKIPTHSYKKEGTYYAKAIVTNGCNNSKSDSIKITISDTLHIATPDIQITPKKPCPGDAVNFLAHYSFNESDNLTSYDLNVSNYEFTWQFAEGNMTGYSTTKAFNEAGKYPYVLKIKNKSGKEITLKDTVVIGTANGIEKGAVSISGDNKTCLGDSTYFVVKKSEKYEFDFGDGSKISSFSEVNINGTTYLIASHKYASVGNYKVKLKTTNGCGDVAYDSLSISINSYHRSYNDMYTYINVDENRSYCRNENVSFTFYETFNVIVDFGDGEKTTLWNTNLLSTFKHAYKTSGNYNVLFKFFNLCGDTINNSCSIYVDTCKVLPSTIETAVKGTMRCYPNPARDRLIIEASNGVLQKDTRYILIDINGRIIMEGILNKESTTTEINLSNISSGLYLLRLSSDNMTEVLKVIKE